MSFGDFTGQTQVIQLLQRSLARERLAHGYLFTGHELEVLEGVARTLAKTLNCQAIDSRNQFDLNRRGAEAQSKKGEPTIDSCDQCDSCRRIGQLNHPDVLWVRPESKSRIITIDQMRELMQTVNLKPTIAQYKVAIISGADRLNPQAANAFLKTLEEPPSKSILILLTTEPQRILETILSRCLRLAFAGEGLHLSNPNAAWLASFSAEAAKADSGLLGRYRLLGMLLARLTAQKSEIEKSLTENSPLAKYEDLEPKMREKLEDELNASVEAEYRRQRTDLISGLQWWLRDVWLAALGMNTEMFSIPGNAAAASTAGQRVSPAEAMENLQVIERLQRQLNSNVQEALALEVGLLKLKF